MNVFFCDGGEDVSDLVTTATFLPPTVGRSEIRMAIATAIQRRYCSGLAIARRDGDAW